MNAFYANNNAGTNNTNDNVRKSNGEYNSAHFVGLRIAGNPTYVPSHINAAGKTVQAMCTFTAYQNLKGKSNRFRFTAWGGMADVVARSCCTGKELNIEAGVNSFQGQVVQPDATGKLHVVQNAQGQPIEIEKTGFVVKEIKLGSDSKKTIDNEIQAGIRGVYWQVPGTQDELNWKATCKQRNAAKFDVNSAWFGFAQVRMPKNGQVIDVNTQGGGQVNAGTAQFAGNMHAVGQAMAPQGQPTSGYQQAPAYQQAPNQAQPVMVNGQNMGYPIAPQQGGFNGTPPAAPVQAAQGQGAQQAPPVFV